MSLFATLGHGDIWSIPGISFASPLTDILDKESFTLEELLCEDELLQEVKTRNTRLIEFLASPGTLAAIIGYIITPPEEDADDLRKFKYSYMSCEILCCEVPEILVRFEASKDEEAGLLSQLFSLLDSKEPIGQYLAGYFEKVLDMLFRRMTSTMMTFMNAGGVPLLTRFLNHVDNYSILQIVQRLMLPHIPFNMNMTDMAMDCDTKDVRCDWCSVTEACDILTTRMIDVSDLENEVPSHISALMMTVLQISPVDSPFLANLCRKECLEKLFASTLDDSADKSNVSIASGAVLEILISRLSEATNPNSQSMEFNSPELGAYGIVSQPIVPEELQTTIESLSSYIEPHAVSLAAQLRTFLDGNPCGNITFQSKTSFPRLGERGMKLVKLVEAFVRLEKADIDRILCVNDVIKICIDLSFKFELNSILHLSVQRMILTIIEAGEDRQASQEYLFKKCALLEHIMEQVSDVYNQKESEDSTPSAISSYKRGPATLARCRRPLLGHLVQIAEYLINSSRSDDIGDATSESSVNVSSDGKGLTSPADDVEAEAGVSADSNTVPSPDYSPGGEDEEKAAALPPVTPEKQNKGNSIANMIEDSGNKAAWETFVSNTLTDFFVSRQYFSPTKMGQDEESGEMESPPVFNGGVSYTNSGPIDDDSDEEEEQEIDSWGDSGKRDQDANPSPRAAEVIAEFATMTFGEGDAKGDGEEAEPEDLFANFDEVALAVAAAGGSEQESVEADRDPFSEFDIGSLSSETTTDGAGEGQVDASKEE